MRYAHPGQPGAVVSFKSAYGNFIDGRFVEPLSGEFFMNTSPVDGSNIAQFPRSDARDIDFALDAAHRAAPAWGKTSVQQRSGLLLQVADRIEQHLEYLAVAESWDNGKPIRETPECRPAAGGGSFSLLRRLPARSGGKHRRD